MGYRGKVVEQEKARELRELGWTITAIEQELGVSRSSVSLWVREVVPQVAVIRKRPQYLAGRQSRHPWHLRKMSEIEDLNAEGVSRLTCLTPREFLVAGVALYAGEGSKTDGDVAFANSDPAMIKFFCAWLREFFAVAESRLRLKLYLHDGLDLDAANAFWAALTSIPLRQFGKPYRAVPDTGIRNTKHIYGCPRVDYSCSRTHRTIMGLVRALLSSNVPSGVAQ